jgi:hypothetical protein
MSGRSRRCAAFLALCAASCVTTAADADSLQPNRSEHLDERTLAYDVRLERGHATIVVTREIENPGSVSDEATYLLDLPQGAAAIRLRTTGVGAKGQPVWFEGELMEASKAAARYTELTGLGVNAPKDPALLAWLQLGGLTLQVFPVPPHGTKTVEYTLRAPMAYEGGAYVLHLPAPTPSPTYTARLSSVSGDDVEVDGVPFKSGTAVNVMQPLDVRLVPRGPQATLDGALAASVLSPARVLIHARVAAAPRLSQTPAHSAVVVLLDTSRSMEAGLDAEIAAARAYLSHFPSADVEVMTFDRNVVSPFGGPLPVREALARLDGFSPVLANGSRIDLALARADAQLARAKDAVRRVLLLTDLQTRELLTPDKMGTGTWGLASGAVLHVATVGTGSPHLARDDASPWAKVPRSTGGLLWRATIDDSDEAAAPFEEWVRPKRIERVVLGGVGAEELEPFELREGEGVEREEVVASSNPRLSVKGELWSRPIEWSIGPSADETLRWSALVFGTPLLFSLSPAEQMKLALAGRAVSPVTSYLAVEPGTRPSTEGIEGTVFSSGSSSSCRGSWGRTYSTGFEPSFDRRAYLTQALGDALAKCKAKTSAATVTIETTLAEIVDVREVTEARSRDAAVEACVGEELWAVALPPGFNQQHAVWDVAVSID